MLKLVETIYFNKKIKHLNNINIIRYDKGTRQTLYPPVYQKHRFLKNKK